MVNKEDLLMSKRLTNVSFFFGFDPVFRIEKFMYELESKLRKLFPEDVVDTKIPANFDPSAPRFLLRHTRKKRFLEISLLSAKLRMVITDSYSKNIENGLQIQTLHILKI